MAQGFRPDRVGDQIREELSEMLARGQVHDPGIGFITLTRVKVSADLQVAHIFYTTLGDAAGVVKPRRPSSGPRLSSGDRSVPEFDCVASRRSSSDSTKLSSTRTGSSRSCATSSRKTRSRAESDIQTPLDAPRDDDSR